MTISYTTLLSKLVNKTLMQIELKLLISIIYSNHTPPDTFETVISILYFVSHVFEIEVAVSSFLSWWWNTYIIFADLVLPSIAEAGLRLSMTSYEMEKNSQRVGQMDLTELCRLTPNTD